MINWWVKNILIRKYYIILRLPMKFVGRECRLLYSFEYPSWILGLNIKKEDKWVFYSFIFFNIETSFSIYSSASTTIISLSKFKTVGLNTLTSLKSKLITE